MKKKTLFSGIICIMMIVALAFTGCGGGSTPPDSDGGAPDEVYNLKLAGQNPADFTDMVLMQEAADEISERTNGGVNITVYPSSQLGDYVPVYEEVMQGTIDMACITMSSHINPLTDITYLPYLITNYEEGKVVWTKGSYLFSTFEQIQADAGVKFIGFIPGGLMGVGTAKPLNADTCFDFSVKKSDALLRLPPLGILQVMADTMQFRTSTLPFADLIPALQTGIVDGWIGGGPELNYVSTRDVIKYYYDYKYMDDTTSLFMNLELFDSMPAEYQDIIMEVMTEKAIEAIDAQAEKDLKYLADLEAYGIEVIVPTDEQREAMADYMRANAWPKLYDLFGQEVMDALIADLD